LASQCAGRCIENDNPIMELATRIHLMAFEDDHRTVANGVHDDQ
jgi:hypothetical protein